ncbi:MAG: YgjP-like metallopeptidase domain-containing protein [Candidatus Nanopelagicales bacterium]
MTIRPVEVPGLPEGIEVRRSTRRRRSVAAHREAGVTIVVVPERMSVKQATEHALAMHARLLKRAAKTKVSDEQLLERALALRARYLPSVATPSSIVWSTSQNRRWGSCTTTDGSIRLSARLQGMPQYVIDYVIVHELAHLEFANHGPDFNHFIDAYPQRERACAFLDGVEFASAEYAQ